MSLSANTLTEKLEVAMIEVDTREPEYGRLLDEEAVAEHAYKVRKAEALLAAEGTEKVKEATSVVESQKEFLRYLKAKAARVFMAEKLADAQSVVSARQSLLAYDGKTNLSYTRQT